jgi:hypothetical protein
MTKLAHDDKGTAGMEGPNMNHHTGESNGRKKGDRERGPRAGLQLAKPVGLVGSGPVGRGRAMGQRPGRIRSAAVEARRERCGEIRIRRRPVVAKLLRRDAVGRCCAAPTPIRRPDHRRLDSIQVKQVVVLAAALLDSIDSTIDVSKAGRKPPTRHCGDRIYPRSSRRRWSR